MFGDGSLFAYYRTNFVLMDRFGYDINFFENLIPYEQEIYIAMLENRLDKESKTS
jgi:hypothetical protein